MHHGMDMLECHQPCKLRDMAILHHERALPAIHRGSQPLLSQITVCNHGEHRCHVQSILHLPWQPTGGFQGVGDHPHVKGGCEGGRMQDTKEELS